MSTGVHADDLPPEIAKQLGLPQTKEKKARMSADNVRTHALRAMAAIAGLSRNERSRVITLMAKLNKV